MKSVQPNQTATAKISPEDDAIRVACALLREDRLVAFPTETVYGLGGNALSPRAIEAIFQAKGRPRHNPLIVHVADEAGARACAAAFSDVAAALAARFWPGPLTVVVPRAAHVPAAVSAGLPTVALRAPAHPLALRLLRAVGLPLAAPSANPSERLSPTTAEHVRRGLPQIPLVLDGGPCPLGLESTVVDLTGPAPRLLRPGALPLRLLRQALPDLVVASSLALSSGPLPGPGMMARHYAPRARVHLLPDAELDVTALTAPIGVLAYGALPVPLLAPGSAALIELLPEDPAGYAADLFAALHRLDDAGVATILAVLPPDHEDFAAARDRLRRAATPA